MTRTGPPTSRRAGALAALGLAFALACGGAAVKGPEAAAPADPGAAAADAGGAPAGAAPSPEHRCAVDYSARHSGRSLLILRGGVPVVETGHNGHPADGAQALGAASQGFWGVAALVARADGLLDLDEPVADTLDEFAADPSKRTMRIRQLLHQTSGLEPGAAALHRETTPDLTARALALEVIAPPGTRFQHGPSHTAVFAELLRRKLAARGDDPEAWLRSRVLGPMGMSLEGWARDDAGNLDAAYGATARPRQWARLGELLAGGGRLGDRTVLSREAVATLLAGSGPAPEFGFGLWRNPETRSAVHAFYPDGLRDLVVSAGEGNQRLYVIPSLDLVVVRTGDPDHGWRDWEFLACLVPQGGGGGAAPADVISGSG